MAGQMGQRSGSRIAPARSGHTKVDSLYKLRDEKKQRIYEMAKDKEDMKGYKE